MRRSLVGCCLAVVSSCVALHTPALSADYPPFDKVVDGYTKVDPSGDAKSSMYTLYTKDKEGQMLIELPKSYSMKKYFIGLTVASGQTFAGLQAGDYYVQWRQYNKRLALISPNMQIRSGGDSESKSSVNRLFTDSEIVVMLAAGLSGTSILRAVDRKGVV